MNKCNQSKAEKEWLKRMEWEGYDKLSANRSFGLMRDKEDIFFRHIPDAVAVNSHTMDLYIIDHKTCELNGAMCKRTADNKKHSQLLRGNRGLSIIASWSNSFYQKDLIQRAFRNMVISKVYYVIVTKKPIEIKKRWKKTNPFILNITEEKMFELKGDLREIDSFDPLFDNHKIDGVGAVLIDPPSVNTNPNFKAITLDGIDTFKGNQLERTLVSEIRARLFV